MSIELIKSLRDKTGLPLKDIKKAIEANPSASEDQIIKTLREQGAIKQQSRSGRETSQGGVFAYSHEGKLGVLVTIKCETDFVARSDDFKGLGNDLALHIAAYQPKFLSEEEVTEDFISAELDVAKNQLLNEGKPEDKIEMILKGKKAKIISQNTLLGQSFLKDPSISVSQQITNVSQKTGENIKVTKFVLVNLND